MAESNGARRFRRIAVGVFGAFSAFLSIFACAAKSVYVGIHFNRPDHALHTASVLSSLQLVCALVVFLLLWRLSRSEQKEPRAGDLRKRLEDAAIFVILISVGLGAGMIVGLWYPTHWEGYFALEPHMGAVLSLSQACMAVLFVSMLGVSLSERSSANRAKQKE